MRRILGCTKTECTLSRSWGCSDSAANAPGSTSSAFSAACSAVANKDAALCSRKRLRIQIWSAATHIMLLRSAHCHTAHLLHWGAVLAWHCTAVYTAQGMMMLSSWLLLKLGVQDLSESTNYHWRSTPPRPMRPRASALCATEGSRALRSTAA